MNREILCIDIKSFFASVECAERGLDSFTTPLVVSDPKRKEKSICLAVTPYLKNMGVYSRSRVYELPKNIDIIYAPPRMKLYELYNKKMVKIYESFIDKNDILVYSIDECFLDVTNYLKYYNSSSYELAIKIMNKLKKELKLSSSCGIGPNMFLAKVALDIEAKTNKVGIARWTFKDVEAKLQEITPLSKIVGIGNRYEKHLNDLKIYKLKDIFKYSKEFYIKRFGKVAGTELYLKAQGIDYKTVQEENKRIRNKSISLSQVLLKDYNIEEAFLIIREMNDMLCRRLRSLSKETTKIHLFVNYSKEINKSFKTSINIESADDQNIIIKEFKKLYYKNIEDLPIRQVGIAFSNLKDKSTTQLSIFDSYNANDKYNKALDEIHKKYGPISILKASSLLETSTIKQREKRKNIL